MSKNAEASYQRELTRANVLQEQLNEARKRITELLAEWDKRIKELERTLAAQRPPEPTRSACGHYDCNEEDCYGK